MSYFCTYSLFFFKFEAFMANTFEENVQHSSTSNKILLDLSRFCKELHSHIEWEIDHGSSTIFFNILSAYFWFLV